MFVDWCVSWLCLIVSACMWFVFAFPPSVLGQSTLISGFCFQFLSSPHPCLDKARWYPCLNKARWAIVVQLVVLYNFNCLVLPLFQWFITKIESIWVGRFFIVGWYFPPCSACLAANVERSAQIAEVPTLISILHVLGEVVFVVDSNARVGNLTDEKYVKIDDDSDGESDWEVLERENREENEDEFINVNGEVVQGWVSNPLWNLWYFQGRVIPNEVTFVVGRGTSNCDYFSCCIHNTCFSNSFVLVTGLSCANFLASHMSLYVFVFHLLHVCGCFCMFLYVLFTLMFVDWCVSWLCLIVSACCGTVNTKTRR